jgi:hypothetical protein
MSADTMPAIAVAGRNINPAIAELARRPAWVCWRYGQRNGKATKVPITPAGSAASSTNPATWSSFEECWAAAFAEGRAAGIGRVLVASEGLVGVDLDDACALDGAVAPWAKEVFRALPTYWERSPSGAGLHAWGRGGWPASGSKRKGPAGNVEVSRDRFYLTVTGDHLAGTPESIERCDAGLEELWARRFFGSSRAAAGGGLFDPNTAIPEKTFQNVRPLAEHVLEHLIRTRPQLRRILEPRDWSQSERDLALVRLAAREGRPREVAWGLVQAIRTDGKELSHYYAGRTLREVYGRLP